MTPAHAAQARNTSIAAESECYEFPRSSHEDIKLILSLPKNDSEISRRKVPEPRAFAVYLGHCFGQSMISARRRVFYER
jgi:hypothetical protein